MISATANPLARQKEWVRDVYGSTIGRSVQEVPTPALLLDIEVAERNIARMAADLLRFAGSHPTPHQGS